MKKLSKNMIEQKRRRLAALRGGLKFWSGPKKWVQGEEVSNFGLADDPGDNDLVMGFKPDCACAIGTCLVGAAEVLAKEKKIDPDKIKIETPKIDVKLPKRSNFRTIEDYEEALRTAVSNAVEAAVPGSPLSDMVNGYGEDARKLMEAVQSELDRDVPEEFGGEITCMNDEDGMTFARMKKQLAITEKRLVREIKTGRA